MRKVIGFRTSPYIRHGWQKNARPVLTETGPTSRRTKTLFFKTLEYTCSYSVRSSDEGALPGRVSGGSRHVGSTG